MPDPTPFQTERLEHAFRSAPTPRSAHQRLELLEERIERMRRAGGARAEPLDAAAAAALRRRVHQAAAREVRALDAPLLVALLLGAADALGPEPPVLRRAELRAEIRALAEPVFGELLDRIEAAPSWARPDLWSVVEALARAVSMPRATRERVVGWLHTLPREILPAYPEPEQTLREFRRPEPEQMAPAAQHALEASAVVRALLADRELPAEQLAALVPRAVRFCDPVARMQLAEHPQADVRVWHALLDAPLPADRALPGRVPRAWADAGVAERLRALGDAEHQAPAARAAVRLRLCQAAPAALARGWAAEVARHEGFAALALFAERPELTTALDETDCAPLLRDPEVRRALRLQSAGAAEAGPGADLQRFAEATRAELLASPGAAFVRRLLQHAGG